MSDRKPRRTEFSPRYKRGRWASRIGTQDKVALIVSIEALGGGLDLVPWPLERGRIAFEAREDFEIRWSDGRQYVSVKDRVVSRRDLTDAIGSLIEFIHETPETPDQSIRIEAASLDTGARSLYEDIKRLRDMDRSKFPDDYTNARKDFRDEHDLDPRYAERIIVADRRIGGSENAGALFSHAMRNALPVHNYGDAQLVALFEELTATVFRQKRENQGILDLADLERMLLAPLIPLPIASYEVSYVATKYGYLLDRKKDAALRAERIMVRSAASSIMRQWRRKTFWARTLNLLIRGPVSCLACGHAMAANLFGRNGLACPKCGYQPYLTIFHACDCGGYSVVQKQPDLSSLIIVRDAIRVLQANSVRCENCKKTPSEEKLLGRLFTLPVPYPIEGYSESHLIQWRKELGWHGRQWRPKDDARRTPRQVMLATNTDDD